jgi:hypothetical protein
MGLRADSTFLQRFVAKHLQLADHEKIYFKNTTERGSVTACPKMV